MDFYELLTKLLIALIVGMFVGGYLVHRLEHADRPRIPYMRQGLHEWARRDLALPEPTAQNIDVRKITDWTNPATSDGRTLTFLVHDTRLGLDRNGTFSASIVLRFLRCDTPTRSEWRGAHGDYSKLLAIAKHHGWIEECTGRYGWAGWFGTRERRLRRYQNIRDHDDPPHARARGNL